MKAIFSLLMTHNGHIIVLPLNAYIFAILIHLSLFYNLKHTYLGIRSTEHSGNISEQACTGMAANDVQTTKILSHGTKQRKKYINK